MSFTHGEIADYYRAMTTGKRCGKKGVVPIDMTFRVKKSKLGQAAPISSIVVRVRKDKKEE